MVTPAASNVITARVLYDFASTGAGQVSLTKGEIVTITTKGPTGGWSSTTVGSFPTDYVEFIAASAVTTTATSSSSNNTATFDLLDVSSSSTTTTDSNLNSGLNATTTAMDDPFSLLDTSSTTITATPTPAATSAANTAKRSSMGGTSSAAGKISDMSGVFSSLEPTGASSTGGIKLSSTAVKEDVTANMLDLYEAPQSDTFSMSNPMSKPAASKGADPFATIDDPVPTKTHEPVVATAASGGLFAAAASGTTAALSGITSTVSSVATNGTSAVLSGLSTGVTSAASAVRASASYVSEVATSAISAPVDSEPEAVYAKVKYTKLASGPTELSVMQGEVVVVLKQDSEGWYGYTIKGGAHVAGYFPGNYVEITENIRRSTGHSASRSSVKAVSSAGTAAAASTEVVRSRVQGTRAGDVDYAGGGSSGYPAHLATTILP